MPGIGIEIYIHISLAHNINKLKRSITANHDHIKGPKSEEHIFNSTNQLAESSNTREKEYIREKELLVSPTLEF